MLSNLSCCLEFLANEEKIKLVGIGPYGVSTSFWSSSKALDILDHNGKLILGLIWTLILHYQIYAAGGESVCNAERLDS